MKSNISTEDKLVERIKELTCLYEVSSYIVNSDITNLENTFSAIVNSIKRAIRFSEKAIVELKVNDEFYNVGKVSSDNVYMIEAIKVFNVPIGSIKVGYSIAHYDENAFLDEEKQLLHKLASEIGSLLERKQIIENEMLVKRQIERADRLGILGEITAGIAHELNTPLTNILGFSELLKDRFSKDDIAIKDLEKIVDSAIYSREVVKKLMFFSCEMPQQMELTNIVPIITDAIHLLKPNFIKKELKHELHFSHETILLKVDSIQLTQVIFNLVINAIYYSPNKATITIDVQDKKGAVMLQIIDEGEGIAKENAERIFNPFYSTKPIGDGSGLGLSVVHGIVKSHKGSIHHEANSPKGTKFVITLPK